MKYCIHCGHELKSDYKYCTQCQGEQPDTQTNQLSEQEQGEQPVDQQPVQEEQFEQTEKAEHPGPETEDDDAAETSEASETTETPETIETMQTKQNVESSGRRTQKKVKPKGRKRNKILIGAVAFLVLLGLGAHLWARFYFDPQRDLKAMDQAIVDDDQDAFYSYISFSDQALLNEDDYFQYIKGDRWDRAKTDMQKLFEEDNDLSKNVYTRQDRALFRVRPVDHIFGLYTTYDLKAEPVSATIQTYADDTNLSIGDVEKTFNTDEQVELSAYPGTFELTADATKQYGKFEQTTSVEIDPSQDNQIDIDFEGKEYTFSTDQPEATLFVNGESTDQQLRNLNSIGPFPEGSEAQLYAQMENDGESIKSDEVTLTEESDTHLTFAFGDEVSKSIDEDDEDQDEIDPEQAADTVLDFRDDYEHAVNDKDFDKISSYLLDGSVAQEELKDYVGDLEETDYDYDFLSNDVKDTETVDDSTVKVVTREQFVFTNHREEKTDYDRQKTYTIELSDGDYKIKAIDYDDTKRD